MPDLYLLPFLSALWGHWDAFMGILATMSALFAASQLARGRQVLEGRVYLRFALVAVFVAAYLAWREEHQGRLTSSSESGPSAEVSALQRRIDELVRQQEPRRLTPEQQQTIATGLKGETRCAAPVVMSGMMGDSEAQRFKQDLAGALLLGGVELDLNAFQMSPEFGLSIVATRDDQCGNDLDSAFRAAGLIPTRREPVPQERNPMVIVGQRGE